MIEVVTTIKMGEDQNEDYNTRVRHNKTILSCGLLHEPDRLINKKMLTRTQILAFFEPVNNFV
ncbi:hypothetical protein GCM10009347_37760 [Shewanella algicola]|nr:hypothetical protein GCM10009347_37760 [Shewanella algicola]